MGGGICLSPSQISDLNNPTDLDRLADANGAHDEANNLIIWQGEVVEVNETAGDIYVFMEDLEHPPCTGSFYVRPFEFLEALNTIYSDTEFTDVQKILTGRLMASRGDLHPPVPNPSGISIEELSKTWNHAWGILWGPPGTGKTYTIGQQVASCLADPSERILVVSTTNKATDEAALSIGRAVSRRGNPGKHLVRIGKNANYDRFQEEGKTWMLEGGEAELLRRAAQLRKLLSKTQSNDERAKMREELQRIQHALKDRALEVFVSANTTVVVSTAFRALTLLKEPAIRMEIEAGEAPFTTIVIDEAGLLPRVTAAALSMLASRQILLVGDPKQLAPISKMSRVLPTDEKTWLAKSGLSHLNNLQRIGEMHPAIYLLTKQYRMHPDIRKVVSEYQYDGQLEDADNVKPSRLFSRDLFGKGQPRAIWYVLDEEGADLPSIRAERGPANRSWIRQITRSVLDKLLVNSEFSSWDGLFISPFAAQAKDIRSYLANQSLNSWTASTVHSQQGAEARIVIFDTVNASSTAWASEEWKRLINVGISRSKEQLIVLASRAEMRQPFLQLLGKLLTPCRAERHGNKIRFVEVAGEQAYVVSHELLENSELLGNQIATRKHLRPILSYDQQRLSRFRMDGKPRLVRGVAGSGKTIVLANWLKQVVRDAQSQDDVIWAVYANYALKGLIENAIQNAWDNDNGHKDFPNHSVEMHHVDELLNLLLEQQGLDWRALFKDDPFNFDGKAELYLQHVPFAQIPPRCTAMFIDEAQDMGANTLRLLTALVKQTDSNDPNSRAVNIFYDNAQNVYGRSTPRWTELGLDMRGRSTVMQESFRSTKPITEYALNVLYALQPPGRDQDHRELVQRQLLDETRINGRDWWHVRFAQTNGPFPLLSQYGSLDRQIDAIAAQIVRWVRDEAVVPGDICLLYNGRDVKEKIINRLYSALQSDRINLEHQTSRQVQPNSNAVLATTTQSFKGYDAEIVVIVSADRFVGVTKSWLTFSTRQ